MERLIFVQKVTHKFHSGKFRNILRVVWDFWRGFVRRFFGVAAAQNA